jgi:ADP-heptose:LPS heptosyltransferase
MSMPEDDWVLAIRSGDYHRAWDLSARLLAARDPRTRDDPSLPYHLRWVWDGRPFEGRHVLVRCYHGLGDTIQFARYLPLLRRHAASVTLEVQPRLACLFADFPGVDRLVPFDPARPSPESECDLEIMELAFALRTPPTRVPPPYLRSAPAVLPHGTIGLCHEAGNWDQERCLAAADLLSACGAEPCLTLACGATDLPVLNPEGCPFDIAATAMLVAGLDLIVTVDTFVAHLAGAMGKPVWLLLKHQPDWRWSPATRRSDWYPSMRLYTQPTPGDWTSVLAEVARDLAERGRSASSGRRSG